MERLQKVLARAGFGSRRSCETLIVEGRVTVDGEVVSRLGTRVDPSRAAITCDGAPVRAQRRLYLAMHKPAGVVCTTFDPQGRKRVVDLLPPSEERVYPVGRLDEDSEGLLILTNDGAFCNLLTHPRYGIEKTYHVTLRGWVDGHALDRVRKGVWLSDGRTSGARVAVKMRARDVSVLEVTISEGMNREIRRVFARIGHDVKRLKRIRIGSLDLGDLPPGGVRPLTSAEVDRLRACATPGGQAAASGREEDRPRRPFRGGRPGRWTPPPAEGETGRESRDGGHPRFRRRFEGPRTPRRWEDRNAGPGESGGDARPSYPRSRPDRPWGGGSGPRERRDDNRRPFQRGPGGGPPWGPRRDFADTGAESGGSRQGYRGPRPGPRGPERQFRGSGQESRRSGPGFRGQGRDSRGPWPGPRESGPEGRGPGHRGPDAGSRGPWQGPRRPGPGPRGSGPGPRDPRPGPRNSGPGRQNPGPGSRGPRPGFGGPPRGPRGS
jgi:23S rRNA pseudouridine2605 synthase